MTSMVGGGVTPVELNGMFTDDCSSGLRRDSPPD